MLTAAILLLGASPDFCDELKRSVFLARAGEASHRAILVRYLQKEVSTGHCAVVLPDELRSQDDVWARDELKRMAVSARNPANARSALIAWWRMRADVDTSWVAAFLERPADDPVRGTAARLLASIGDSRAVALLEKGFAQICGEMKGQLGLILRSTVVLELIGDPERPSVIEHVCAGSRAATAGLRAGEWVLAVNGRVCDGPMECQRRLLEARDWPSPWLVAVQTPDGRLETRRVPAP